MNLTDPLFDGRWITKVYKQTLFHALSSLVRRKRNPHHKHCFIANIPTPDTIACCACLLANSTAQNIAVLLYPDGRLVTLLVLTGLLFVYECCRCTAR